jgi:hypothetical protein
VPWAAKGQQLGDPNLQDKLTAEGRRKGGKEEVCRKKLQMKRL